MKNMKRVLSSVMAATTLCAMSASAFASSSSSPAASNDSSNAAQTIGFSGSTTDLTIAVTVPSQMAFTIDPYSQTDGKGQVYPSAVTGGAINQKISSTTKVPVNIMVTTCKGTIPTGSELKLMGATPPEETSVLKQAQLFLRAEVGEETIDTNSPRYRAATAVREGDVLVTLAGTANALLVTLPADNGSAAVGITGVVTTNALWKPADSVDVNVALNIVPQPKA